MNVSPTGRLSLYPLKRKEAKNFCSGIFKDKKDLKFVLSQLFSRKNDIDWSNVTSGVGLAGFSTRVRYLRVSNSIPFEFYSAGRDHEANVCLRGWRWSRGAKPLLTEPFWVIFQPFFWPPGRFRDVRRSPIVAAPASGPSTRQSSPESPAPSRDPPNTDEHLYVVDLRDPGLVPVVKLSYWSRSSISHTIVPDNSTFNASLYASNLKPLVGTFPVPLGPESLRPWGPFVGLSPFRPMRRTVAVHGDSGWYPG